MPFLSQILLHRIADGGYTSQIPSLREGLQLNLKSNVTFFVGENGSGKSTLLEGIAEGVVSASKVVTATITSMSVIVSRVTNRH